MTEPLVIQKLKKLAEVSGRGYAFIAFSEHFLECPHFTLYDHVAGHTFPKTDKDLLADLDRRIADAEKGLT